MQTADPNHESPSDRDSQSTALSAASDADIRLPPVEAPDSRFIIQLFVLPAVIVAAVVLLWFTTNWLANRGAQDPEQIVRSLNSSNQSRFQKAKELADMLRMPQRYQLNSNVELCQALSELLDEKVDAGLDAESEVTMRYILAGALGEFYVQDGLEALIRTARLDPERDVRRRAINAIAVLGQTFVNRDPPEALFHPDLTSMLSEMANQPDDELLRSETAFAIGVLVQAPDADSELIDELALLTEDFYPDARYNAAISLARIGDIRAIETIAEMLDVDLIKASVEGEVKFDDRVSDASVARHRAEKQDLILRNAIKAVDSLLGHHSPTKLSILQTAIQNLIDRSSTAIDNNPPISRSLRKAAARTLSRFDDGV